MKTIFNKLVVLGALAGTAASLSGCFPLAAGGALMTGFVVTDRRTSGALVEDQGIELKATNRIRDTLGEKVHVNVASYNRKVLLTGEAPNPQDKEKVADLVREIENVTTTWNEIGVLPITSLSERSSDIIISGRIKAELLDTKDLISNAFKITVERGVVFVMGRITPRESKRVASLVSGVTGVKKVVLVHEPISEDELARLQPSPAPK